MRLGSGPGTLSTPDMLKIFPATSRPVRKEPETDGRSGQTEVIIRRCKGPDNQELQVRHVPQGRLARRLHAALAPGRRRRAVLTAPHLAGGRQLPTFSFSSRQPVPNKKMQLFEKGRKELQ